MKRSFCIILLLLSGLLIADSNEFSMIGATTFGRDYLKDYGVVSALSLEGEGHSYAISKDTGAIVIFSNSDERLKFHYLDINGTTIWTNSIFPIQRGGNLRNLLDISDDGKRVLIQKFFRLTNQYVICDDNRNTIFTKDVRNITYQLSSNGQFLLTMTDGFTEEQTEAVIYDIYGDPKSLPLQGNYEIEEICQCFVSPDKLISQILTSSGEKHLVCFEISDGVIRQLWDKITDYRYMSSGIYQQLKSYDDWIGLGANNDDLRLININTGDVVKEYKGRNGSWGISQKGNILLNGSDKLRYIDRAQGSNAIPVEICNSIDYNSIQDFIELDDGMIINLHRDFWSPQKYASFYYTNGDLYYLESHYHFIHCNNKDYIIAINLHSAPEVIIYVKNDRVDY